MTRKEFCALLRSRYAPHYVYPRFEPEELWDYFHAGIILAQREVKSGVTRQQQSVRVDAKAQADIYASLISMKEIQPYIIGISSYPSEFIACETAACIQLALMRSIPTLRWLWTTSAFDPRRGDRREDNPQVVVVRSIIASEERLYAIRDILDAYPRALRLVVLSGVDPLDYFDNYLKYPISGAINIVGTKEKLPSQVYVKSPNTDYSVPSLLPRDVKLLLKKLREDIL